MCRVSADNLWAPLLSFGADQSAPAACTSFIRNATHYRELNCPPVPLVFGADICVDKFIKNRAHWHKSCHAKFNTNRLARGRKRESDEMAESSTSEGRRRIPCLSIDTASCTKQGEGLHEFSTLGTDHNVRSMAILVYLQETRVTDQDWRNWGPHCFRGKVPLDLPSWTTKSTLVFNAAKGKFPSW